MKIDKAIEISDKIAELKKVRSQIDKFNKTKEFCTILIRGENGNESEHSLQIGSRSDPESIRTIRKCIENLLRKEEKEIVKSLTESEG